IEPSRCRQFIPQVTVLAYDGVLTDVARRWSIRGFDAVKQLASHSGLDRNVDWSAHNLVPLGPQHDVSRFWIEPQIEFMSGRIHELRIIGLRTQASAHKDEFLH